jgi:Protein of unknown function (DUF1552)
MKKYSSEPGEFEASRLVRPTRRQFLRGAGGAAMLLPLLPSLLSRSARAQTTAPNKRFIYIGTEHGAASFDNMYGTQTGATSVDLWAGGSAHYGPLALSTSGGKASLSPILTASDTVLTPAIVQKMNVIRGIDFANSVGHQDGAHLGNNASQVGDRGPALTPMVTIDQVMAYSPNFYSEVPRVPSVSIGGSRCLTWTYTNPSTRSGVQKLQRYQSSLPLFNAIFGTPNPTPSRPLIIDRVLQNYNSLRQSNRRLSAADKIRLDDHIGRLTQLQLQVTAQNRPLSCGMPAAPADNVSTWAQLDDKGLPIDQQTSYYKLMADILLTAFSCGATRIGVFHEIMPYSIYQGDWHQDIAHQFPSAIPQATLSASYQQVFEHLFMYLANGLDAIKDPDGSTALDNSLLCWGQECGYSTHDPWAVPIIMAGKAGGYFKTGLYVDYRNQVPASQVYTSDKPMPGNFNGLIYPQFLATALYSMGVQATEWKQPNGLPGYGDYKNDLASLGQFQYRGALTRPDGVVKNASMPLPIITGV